MIQLVPSPPGPQGLLLAFVGSLVALIGLGMTPHTKENANMRLGGEQLVLEQHTTVA